MAAISIRDLDDDVRDRLRVRAAENGHSMEAEARAILTRAVETPTSRDLVSALIEAAREVGGVELDIPPRTEFPRAVTFDE